MWALFLKGGITMIPLSLFSILFVAVTIEKIITLRKGYVLQPAVIDAIESLRTSADVPMAIKMCEKYNTAFANTIRSGLEEAHSSMADIRQTMEDTGRREVKRLERYLVVLETVAAGSPLLGLLGTVLGMIRVFSVISVEGVGRAGSLSGGISEALITTAFGLFIGIFALVAYNYFNSRVDNMAVRIEAYVHLLLKRLGAMKQEKTASLPQYRDAT